jgi:hypothetical protein
MSSSTNHRAALVIGAGTLVLLLAVSLVVRVAAGARDSGALERSVPQPRPIELSELDAPFCWGCAWNENAALEFQVDLDLLAPLGTGEANAAAWFADFAFGGPRVNDGRKGYVDRMIDLEIDGDSWHVLPGDDPLVLEAEPWADQATCSFYPEIWEVAGHETPVPQLLMMLDLARAWVARGKLAEEPAAAVADYRRAIRLGRLLRQDDVTLIQDLVAIAAIRIGAEALYLHARGEGDAATMLVASLVLADKDAMRLYTARRITTLSQGLEVEDLDAGQLAPAYSEAEVEEMVELTRSVPGRRFKMEGAITLNAVRHTGSASQRELAQSALEELAAGDDEALAGLAESLLAREIADRELREFLSGMLKYQK